MNKKIRKAIIPAAGLGTRFLPATKAQPKEMLPIVDKPTIQYIVEEAISSGIEDIIIVTGRNKRAIEDHFDKSFELEYTLNYKGKNSLLEVVEEISNMVDIHYIRQKEPLGLGHAIYCARKFIGNEPFAVLLGDDIVDAETPCLRQMIKVYEEYHQSVIAVQKVKTENLHKYGVVGIRSNIERIYNVNSVVEKPKVNAPSNLAVIGKYILDPSIFELIENTTRDKNGEIQLADALNILGINNKLIAYEFEGKRYDVGDKLGFLQATVEFALQREDLHIQFKDYLANLLEDQKVKL